MNRDFIEQACDAFADLLDTASLPAYYNCFAILNPQKNNKLINKTYKFNGGAFNKDNPYFDMVDALLHKPNLAELCTDNNKWYIRIFIDLAIQEVVVIQVKMNGGDPMPLDDQIAATAEVIHDLIDESAKDMGCPTDPRAKLFVKDFASLENAIQAKLDNLTHAPAYAKAFAEPYSKLWDPCFQTMLTPKTPASPGTWRIWITQMQLEKQKAAVTFPNSLWTVNINAGTVKCPNIGDVVKLRTNNTKCTLDAVQDDGSLAVGFQINMITALAFAMIGIWRVADTDYSDPNVFSRAYRMELFLACPITYFLPAGEMGQSLYQSDINISVRDYFVLDLLMKTVQM